MDRPMTPRVHIEGMGWLGAATAYTLDHRGIGFTWHDTAHPYSAWRACPGMVHPAGDDRSMLNLDAWGAHYRHLFPPGTVTEAAYCYTHKQPPHGGTYRPRADLGWARIAPMPCYIVDVPTIVHAARAQFARHRLLQPPRLASHHAPRIIAHGNTGRRDSWVWGWSAPVQLHLPDDLLDATAGQPVALYGRQHRFAATYAYPIPHQPGWWAAGTSLMKQRHPKRLDAATALDRWVEHAATLYPTVKILDIGTPIHGWAPSARPNDPPLPTHGPHEFVLPPLRQSGVRWAPGLLADAAQWADHITATQP